MKPRLSVLVIALCALAVPGSPPASAQPSREISVDEVVALAFANNPELLAARAEIEAAAARVTQAGLRPNPMLDLGGQKALSPDNTVNVGLSLPLDLNGRKEGRVEVAARELELRRAQVDDRERRLRADIKMKSGELLAARRNLGVADDLLRANRDALGLVGERVRQGAAPTLDENLMRVEVARLEASRIILANRLEVAGLQLTTLAGQTPEPPVALRGDLATLPSVPERGDVTERALADRPDVRAARAETATALARIRREQAEGRWDASVSLGYQRQDFGFDLKGITDRGGTRPIQDVFHYFGAGLSITLPVRNRNQGNVAAAEAEAKAAERRHQLAMLVARQEITAAWAQYDAVRRAQALYERGVRAVARVNLDTVRAGYGLGRGTLLDVIAEQRRYIEVENGYTDTLRQVWDAAVELERVIGAPAR